VATNLPSWPASLPAPLVSSCNYSSQTNVIQTAMDAGAGRRRRRFTAVPETVTFSLLLTRSQVQTLRDFASITLGDVLPFEWEEFRMPEGPTNRASYRFNARPGFVPAGSGDHWIASLDLELLTTADGRFLLDVSDENTGLTNT